MRFVSAAFAVSVAGGALAHPGAPHKDAQGRYTLEAEGIKAQFIDYGATLTNLWVKGVPRLEISSSSYTIADLS
jgi:aldose 1-epimerase